MGKDGVSKEVRTVKRDKGREERKIGTLFVVGESWRAVGSSEPLIP